MTTPKTLDDWFREAIRANDDAVIALRPPPGSAGERRMVGHLSEVIDATKASLLARDAYLAYLAAGRAHAPRRPGVSQEAALVYALAEVYPNAVRSELPAAARAIMRMMEAEVTFPAPEDPTPSETASWIEYALRMNGNKVGSTRYPDLAAAQKVLVSMARGVDRWEIVRRTVSGDCSSAWETTGREALRSGGEQ